MGYVRFVEGIVYLVHFRDPDSSKQLPIARHASTFGMSPTDKL